MPVILEVVPADSPTPADSRLIDDPAALAAALEQLAMTLDAAPGSDGAGEPVGEVVGLIPCESAGEPVAIVARADAGGAPRFHYSLVRLDGSVVDDAHRLREAFVLVAMTEAVREMLEPDVLHDLHVRLTAFEDLAREAGLAATDTVTAISVETRAVIGQLHALALAVAVAVANDTTPIPATPRNLDRMGTLFRELESAWKRLEQQLELVANQVYATRRDVVEALWAALAAGRRDMLLTSVADVIEQGRKAGLALADEALGD